MFNHRKAMQYKTAANIVARHQRRKDMQKITSAVVVTFGVPIAVAYVLRKAFEKNTTN